MIIIRGDEYIDAKEAGELIGYKCPRSVIRIVRKSGDIGLIRQVGSNKIWIDKAEFLAWKAAQEKLGKIFKVQS